MNIRNSPDWPHRSFQENITPAHLNLKLAEFDCLRPFAGSFEIPGKIDTYQQYFRIKMDLRDAIRAKAAKDLGCGESRLSRKAVRAGGLNFKFVYQRMQVDLQGAAAVKLIYKGLKISSRVDSCGVFTTSCQAAVATLFHVLKLLLGDFATTVSDGAYWETLEFLTKFSFQVEHVNQKRSTFSKRKRIIYLDSSTEAFFLQKGWQENLQIENCSMLVVDTTCVSLNSEKLGQLIEICRKAGLVCAFVRSHMKLDCLALEYGRLGSIVFLSPDKADPKARVLFENITRLFNEVAALTGSFANLAQIYPFFSDTRFHQINNLWQKRIETANRNVANYLDESLDFSRSPLTLKKFEHQKYFWIVTKSKIKSEQVLHLCKNLDRNLSFLKVPHLSIASYPWDFLAITPFKRGQSVLLDQKDRTVIRISVPDFDSAKIEDVKSALHFWISESHRIFK